MGGADVPSLSAYAGSPARIRSANAFDFLFSQPFATENQFTPRAQIVPPIDDDRPIFVSEASDQALTYSQLKKDALAFAAGLQGLGLDPADSFTLPPTRTCPRPEIAPVVLIQLPNCLQFATTFLGTVAAGLTASLASPGLTSKEIGWILQNVRPRVIITATTCFSAVQDAIRTQTDRAFFDHVPVHTVDVAGDAYPAWQKASGSDWKRLLASSGNKPLRAAEFDPESRTAVILWSSGTSGRSKGVLLSHYSVNFSAASLWYDADFYLGQQQRWLGFVPFFHVYGFSNVFLLAICTGSTVFTMPAFKLDAALAAIPRRRITYLHMAPPIVVILAKSPAVEPYARRDSSGRNAFSSVVAGITGGAPLGHDIVRQVYSRLGFRVRLGYGLTESTGGITVQGGLGEEDMQAQDDGCGHAGWGVEVMISADSLDPSSPRTSRAAAFGNNGEVLVRSKGLMSAYLPAPGAAFDMTSTTEALTSDGWFRTGDVGTIDEKGNLTITDRVKELIKVKGYQVAPAELEAILCSSDAVADAGVVPVRDEAEATEYPRAYVVAAGTGRKSEEELRGLAQELRARVEEQTARYKWLRGGIVFVSQIPKSPSGKILRRIMRDGGVKGFEVALYEPRRKEAKL